MTNVEPALMAEAEKLGMVFEEPPIQVGGRGRQSVWTRRLVFLRQYPGVWAKFESKNDAAKHQIKKTPGDWTVTQRNLDGVGYTFIRYNGPADA